MVDPDDSGSNVGVVAELDDEAKGEAVIGSAEEREEDVLAESGRESGGNASKAAVDEDGDVGVAPREDVADEVRVHGGAVRSEDAIERSGRGVRARSDCRPVGGGGNQSIVVDVGHGPGNNDELRAELLGVISHCVRVTFLADDRDVRLNVDSAKAAKLTEELQSVVREQQLVLLGGLHDGERTACELDELEGVDANGFVMVGDGRRCGESTVAVRVRTRQSTLLTLALRAPAFGAVDGPGGRCSDLRGGGARVHGVRDRLQHLRDEHGSSKVLDALKNDQESRSVLATARGASRGAKEGVSSGLVSSAVTVGSVLSVLLGLSAEPLMVALRVDCERTGGRSDRKEDSDQNEHREQLLLDDSDFQSNVEHNQLNETLAGHEHADGSRLAPCVAADLGHASTAEELAAESEDHHEDDVAPNLARVKGCKIGVETGQDEVDGQEEHGDKVIDALRNRNSESALVGDNETSEESTEDGMNTDDAGNESRREHNEQSDSHNHWCRTVLKGATAAGQPAVTLADGPEEDDRPTDGAEQDVHGVDATASGGERESQGEEDPAHDVVTDTSGQDDDSDLSVEKLRGRQNATQHREGCDRHGDTDEQEEVTEFGRLVRKVVIDGNGGCGTEAERNDHSGERDQRRVAPVALHDRRVDFKTDDEQEEHETDCRDQVQIRDRLLREDVLREPRDPAKGSRAEEDSSDDLGDNLGLLDEFEEPSETLREGDDDEELNDEERDGLRWSITDPELGPTFEGSNWTGLSPLMTFDLHGVSYVERAG